MAYQTNPLVGAVGDSPITEAYGWIDGRDFPPDKPLIDLSQALPGYAPATALIEHLAGRLGAFETSRYTNLEGTPELRHALAKHSAEVYQGDVAAETVFITAGCNQAFSMAISSLARDGDEVIVPLPYYFVHQMWLDMQGIRIVPLTFRPDQGGIPDVAEAAAKITERTRAIILISPNNPSGAVYPPEVIDAFFELARDHGIALFLDETYRDFLPASADPPHRLFQRPDWADTLVHLYSFSKVYCLTGYRVGAIICGPRLMTELGKAMECFVICAPRISQDAALFGIEHLGQWRRDKQVMMNDRRLALEDAFRRNDLEYQLTSVGAYFAYLRHPFDGTSATDVARRLATEQNLLCLPGPVFGPGQDNHLRLAFANAEADLMPEVARRLVASQT
jgi:aspartate/methionine/tyrosine aminotransferase